MSSDTTEDRDVLVLTLEGDLDLATASRIDAFAALAASSGKGTVLFDVSAVTFIDSQGLHALLRARQAVQAAGGVVRLRSPSPSVELLLHLAGVDGDLPVERS
jgi:stage II sporulation protein AA (anti-sigma F factor antagonist)